MKILHFSAVKSWGGGGNHIENLCYELSQLSEDVENYIVVGEGGQFHERLKKSTFKFSTVPLLFNLDPRAILKLIWLCKRKKFDLVHLHGPTSLAIAVIATKLAKLPPFIFSKKTSFPIKNRKQTLYKYNHSQVKKVFCVSYNALKVVEHSFIDKEKLKVIYHGTRVNNHNFNPSFQLKQKLGLSNDCKIVGNIGNHINAKDLITWVSTIYDVVRLEKRDNIHFVQIGTTSKLTHAIEQEIEKYKIKEFISFLGYLPNASDIMSQFDILLVTSKSEGLPQVIYEAALHKVPVVSTNVGGIPEFIKHEYNGLLSEKGDAVGLAENVEVLLANPVLGKTFAERSHKKLFPEFTTEYMAQKTLQQYREVVKSRR